MQRLVINSAHGSDTRNAINANFEYLFQGVETMDKLSDKADLTLKEAQRINGINNNTNDRLDNIIADSGTSSTEVIDARGSHTVLSARLNELNKFVGDAGILGGSYRSISESLFERGANVKDFGARGTGSGNDSQAFLDAVESINEKGVVIIPKGHFVVEGLPIREGLYYVGTGVNSTILRSPDTPTSHMFLVSEGMSNVLGGGVEGATILGSTGTSTNPYNALDFSSLDRLERFTMRDIKVQFFDKGYNGTDNDRWAYMVNAQFYDNRIGIHCGEHPIMVNVDCRQNDIALTGRINDMTALNCRFNYNRVGIEPSPSPLGNYVANSIFQNCGFFRNTEKAAELDSNNIVVGGRPSGNNNGDVGFVLKGHRNMILGLSLAQNESTGFEKGFIVLDGARHSTISHNTFNLAGGPGIVASDSEITLYNKISDNNVSSSGLKMHPFIKTSENLNFYYNDITDNFIVLSRELTGPTIDIPLAEFGGNQIMDNTIHASTNTVGDYALRLDARDSNIDRNKLRIHSSTSLEPLEILYSNNRTFGENDGFHLEGKKYVATGEATIPDGETSITVEHGLYTQPKSENLQITLRNNIGNKSVWVGPVTRTQFVVNISDPTGAALFNWRVEV